MSERLLAIFPGLRTTPFRVTSPADPAYNCMAWAARLAAMLRISSRETPFAAVHEDIPRDGDDAVALAVGGCAGASTPNGS